jgi:hypothetical protein
LLLYGSEHPRTFKLIKRSGSVPSIVEAARHFVSESIRFTRLAIAILYELCRMQKLSRSDLSAFDQETIWFLLRYIEFGRDEEDPSSYKCIKLLVALNEQYMVASLPQTQQPFPRSPSNTSLALADNGTQEPQENYIIKILSAHGPRFKCFGENLIRLLNRERDPAVQLLILKILFLLFTNEETHEYFFTNDLYVLVDVFIRELYDLPLESEALRHTYLRVLHPLLTNTQLSAEPHYKPAELVKLLTSLNVECSHFGPVGATTVRLLARCLTVPWLLPPRKRRLRLPKPPSFPERKRSLVNSLLGFNLGSAVESTNERDRDRTQLSSSASSIRSFDSVTSVAKVKPPPPMRKGLAPLVEGKPTHTIPSSARPSDTRGRRPPPPPVPDVKAFRADKPLVPERRRTPAPSAPTTPTRDEEDEKDRTQAVEVAEKEMDLIKELERLQA